MRIVLACHHAQVRWALRVFLSELEASEVVGEVTHSDALLGEVSALRPDLVLLEWTLSGMPGGELLDALREQGSPCRIVVVGHRPEFERVALEAGADAYLCMTSQPSQALDILARQGLARPQSS